MMSLKSVNSPDGLEEMIYVERAFAFDFTK